MEQKEFLEEIVKRILEVQNLIAGEQDEWDTTDWHYDSKNYNADLNALLILAANVRRLAEEMIEDYSDDYDDDDYEDEEYDDGE